MRSSNMLQGPLLKNIVFYTLPIIATSILQLLFNAADLVVVGQYCGSVAVAAIGPTGPLTNLIVNLFVGLSVGAGVSVAHGLGEKNAQKVHCTVHTALSASLVGGAILTAVGVLGAETFLRLMQTPADVLPLSTVYMQIYFGGIVFSMVYNFCAAILRAAGDTKSPLIFLSIAGVINVLLNILFVTAFDMGVAGVALATILSQGVSAALVLLALTKRTDACKLQLSRMRFYATQLKEMIRIGLPAGIQGSLFSISNVLIQTSINSFSSVTLISGNAAAGNLEGFVFVTINAFHQTAVNFIGQNKGARQYARIRSILGICLGCVLAVGLVAGILMFICAPLLLPFYITDSSAAVQYGMLRLSYICIPYALCGLMDVTTGALRGIGASFTPMLLSILGVCGIRLGWIYTLFQLPAFHTPQSLYLSYPVSWSITFLCQFTAFILIYRRIRKRDVLCVSS